jgi:hypothetical protein
VCASQSVSQVAFNITANFEVLKKLLIY